MINTRKASDRRSLRFERLDDAIHDAESLAEVESNGRLRATGNWTLGQAIGHIAFWARAPFDGYPGIKPTPVFVRWIARLLKKSFLNIRLPAGGRIPGVPAGTYGVARLDTPEALAQLRTAFERLGRESPQVPNLIFGTLTHDEWIKLNLRHAELHLSFFHPQQLKL